MFIHDIVFAQLEGYITQWYRVFIRKTGKKDLSKEQILQKVKKILQDIKDASMGSPSTSKIFSISCHIQWLWDLHFWACQLGCYEIADLIDEEFCEMRQRKKNMEKEILKDGSIGVPSKKDFLEMFNSLSPTSKTPAVLTHIRLQDLHFWACQFGYYKIADLIDEKCCKMRQAIKEKRGTERDNGCLAL